MLVKLFSHCQTAMAFNTLSAHNPKKDFELHYVYPEEMLEFTVKNLSPFSVVRHDRIPYDFMMFVYRNMTGYK